MFTGAVMAGKSAHKSPEAGKEEGAGGGVLRTPDEREHRDGDEDAVDATQATPLGMNDGSVTLVDATVLQSKQQPMSSSCWGYLARGETRCNLHVREAKDGRINAHVLGRNLDCDIVVNDRRVSGKHCIIYCEYESIMARMRVYVEDIR